MRKNTIKARENKEFIINSEIWRGIINQSIVGFAVSVMNEEVEKLKREIGSYGWGTQKGYIRVMGSRIKVNRPRSRKDGSELELDTYKKMQGKKEWSEDLTNIVLGGLAQRQFEGIGNVLGTHYGLSKSQISRNVIQGLKQDYESLMKASCEDIVGLMIDGIHFGKKPNQVCVIAALGITQFGNKRLLGLWAGGTENSSVAIALIQDLISRGMKEPKITVLDGSKALKKAVQSCWNDAVIARCQEHKKRNILDHLSDIQEEWAKNEYQKIVNAPTYIEGYENAVKFATELKKINDSAYRSFSEGMEEILIPLLIEDSELRKFFSTTNPIESVFSTIRKKTERVKRWRNANSVMYWISTGYRQQAKNLRKIKGFKALTELNQIKERLDNSIKSRERRVA